MTSTLPTRMYDAFWNKIAIIPVIHMEKHEDRKIALDQQFRRVGAPMDKIVYVPGIDGFKLVYTALAKIDREIKAISSYSSFVEYWAKQPSAKLDELLRKVKKVSVLLKDYKPFIDKLTELGIFDIDKFYEKTKITDDTYGNKGVSLEVGENVFKNGIFKPGELGHALSYKTIMYILSFLKGTNHRVLLLEDDVKFNFTEGDIAADITRVLAHPSANSKTIVYFGMSKRHHKFGGGVEDLGNGVGKPIGVPSRTYAGLITGTHAILFNKNIISAVGNAMKILTKPTDHIISDLVKEGGPLNALTTMKLYIEPLDNVSSTMGKSNQLVYTTSGKPVGKGEVEGEWEGEGEGEGDATATMKPTATMTRQPKKTGSTDSLSVEKPETAIQIRKPKGTVRFASNVEGQKGVVMTIAADEQDDLFQTVIEDIKQRGLFDPEIYIDDADEEDIRTDIYIKSVLVRKVVLNLNEVGRNLVPILRTMLNRTYTGKCIPEGYVRTGSVEIVKYTAGRVILGAKVEFNVLFTCLICNPVAGMTFLARVVAMSKAGLVAHYTDGKNKATIARPIVAFIARDHMYLNDRFTKAIKVGEKVKVNVLKTHFELGDPNVYVMGIIDDFEEMDKQRKLRETMETKRIRAIENRTLATVRDTIAEEERRENKYAAVWLFMKNREYLAGILASVYSWKMSGSKAETVVMITPDLAAVPEIMTTLRTVVDRIVEVPYIRVKSQLREGIMGKYGTWYTEGYTKWNCLKLEEYEKVLLMDADTIIFNCMDELFDLNAPAGTFSSPWIKPYSDNRNAKPNVYAGHDNHGDLIPLEMVEHGKNTNFLIGTTVLLRPNIETYNRFVMWLYGQAASNENGFGLLNCGSMLDEQAITLFYHEHKVQWTYIDHRYNAIPWYQAWTYRVKQNELGKLAMNEQLPNDKRIYLFHYFNIKPWSAEMSRTKFADLEPWWEMVQRLCSQYPSLRNIYNNDIDDYKTEYECPICAPIGYPDKIHSVFHTHEGEMMNRIRCPNLEVANVSCPRIGSEARPRQTEPEAATADEWDRD